MTKKSDVQYFTDERGRKKSVLMSYSTYQRMLEDIADLQCIEDRRNEPRHKLEDVISDLKNAE